MKLSQILTLFVVFVVIAAIASNQLRKVDTVTTAARDTMRIITFQRDTVRDTIRVREKARQHWDTIVRNVSDTQVVIQRERPETVTVAREVIQRDRSKDSLLASLYVDRRLDSLWHIQDAKLPHKRESPWGIGATCGVDPFNTNGPRCTFGVTYRAKIRLPFLR